MVTYDEYRKALENVAKENGVSTKSVEASYRACVKKSAASCDALFLPYSVITLWAVEEFKPRNWLRVSRRRGGARGLAPTQQDKGAAKARGRLAARGLAPTPQDKGAATREGRAK